MKAGSRNHKGGGLLERKVQSVRNSIVRELKEYGRVGGNPKLQAYLGSPYPVLGLSTPQLRVVVNRSISLFKEMDVRELSALAELLWSGPTFEEKSFAISLFERHLLLGEESWSIADRWVDQAVGWALCDSLGSGPISALLLRKPERFEEVLRWAGSRNFWRRRVSAYAMRDFVFGGEIEKPLILLERLLYDEEFWVQRAVGTWLRECWKKDRERTETFLLKHVEGLPRVVITVATERASRRFREELRWRRTGNAMRPGV